MTNEDKRNEVNDCVLDLVLDLAPDRGKIEYNEDYLGKIRKAVYDYISHYSPDLAYGQFYPSEADDFKSVIEVGYIAGIPIYIKNFANQRIDITAYRNIKEGGFYFIGILKEREEDGRLTQTGHVVARYADNNIHYPSIYKLTESTEAVMEYHKQIS